MKSRLLPSISTTRTSGASTFRGLSRCQPSKSICRVRSPVAIEISTARAAIAAHSGVTRLELKGNFKPVIGAQHLYRRPFASQFLVTDAVLMQPLDLLVVEQRIV